MCLYPKLIKNRKFEPNKKNGGVPPLMIKECYMFQQLVENVWNVKRKNQETGKLDYQKTANILQNYAKKGDKILDTHGGSMTLARACYEEGFDLDIMELDKEYFDTAVQKFKEHVSQYNLF